jgi:hypothetical protein
MTNKALQQTGHAMRGSSEFDTPFRVGRLLSGLFRLRI